MIGAKSSSSSPNVCVSHFRVHVIVITIAFLFVYYMFPTTTTIFIRNEQLLAQSIRDARAGGYALGVKLVRGAYHPLEVSAHAQLVQQQERQRNATSVGYGVTTPTPAISPDLNPPVWTTKEDTDMCYERCLSILIGAVEEDVRCADSYVSFSKLHHFWSFLTYRCFS